MRAGERLGNRFIIGKRVGAGAMGVVYAAEDVTSGRTVAVKILAVRDPDSLARFDREVAILERLRHPNVVEYIAHSTSATAVPYLAMDWLEGETLKERLQAGPIAYREVVDIGLGIARALADVHAVGIVHRDLKPANVFLVARMSTQVRVLDFGVARYSGGRRPLTAEGDILGTPQYMAPEQALGSTHVDARADLFSLGAVLFRCATGRTPFVGDALEVLLELTRSQAPTVASVAAPTPVRLARLIDALLQRDPLHRPPSAHAVFAELGQIQAETGGRAATPVTRALTSTGAGLAAPAGAIPPTPSAPNGPSHSFAARSPRGAGIVIVAIAGGAIALSAVVGVLAYSAGRAHQSKAPRSDTQRAPTASSIPPAASPPLGSKNTNDGGPPICTGIGAHCSKLAQSRLPPDEFVAAALAFAKQQDPHSELGGGTLQLEPDGQVDTVKKTQSMAFAPSVIVASQSGWLLATHNESHVAGITTHCRLNDIYRNALSLGLDVSQGSFLNISSTFLLVSTRTPSRACGGQPGGCSIQYDLRTCAQP